MAFTPSSLGTSESNLAIAQHNLDFSQAQLAKYQQMSSFETDPAKIAVINEEIAAYQADIVDYQEKVTGYQDLISANPATPADPVVVTATDSQLPASTPGIQAFDDGSTLQTFDDGSTLATATDGTVTSSPAPAEKIITEESPTNKQPAENVDNGLDASAEYTTDSLGNTYKNGTLYRAAEVDDTTGEKLNTFDSSGRLLPVSKGATPANPPAAQAQWSAAKDLRVKLRVPNEYLVGPAAGPANIIQKNGGILFPYTPTISMENQASYAAQNPLHSNYPLYFYKNSSVGPISISAKFTVQNEYEGAVLLGVIHLLRGLTKMKWGNDPDAGSPPPVCRFDAYGDYMLNNVPVSIASWRHELPDNVDYISVGRNGSPTTYGHSMVPAISVIQITLNVMYSRREMLSYNVKDWQSGSLRNRGYL
jgi:hypothetical protein